MSILIYLWAAFWCSIIASCAPHAPKNKLGLIFGSIVIGLIWPLALMLYVVFDLPELEKKCPTS